MHKKYKIYYFHPYSQVGGADLSISRIINGLDDKIFDVVFISLSNPLIKKYIKKKIKFVKIKSKKTLFSIFKIQKFLKNDFNKKYYKHIFVSNQNFANVISFFILYKLKWIKHILIERNHIDEFKFNKNIVHMFKNKIISLLMKVLFKHADVIIGISKKLSNDLEKFINSKVKNIYNPSYDKDIYKLSKFKIKKKYSFKKFILSIGRLEDQKDHMTLLKAYKEISDKINYKLIIIGYGTELNKIKNFIKNNNLKNRVIILTNIKNAFPYYKFAKIFILSSKYEGFGNVLVEAAMFKIPIISSNCNSGPLEILNHNKGGEIFPVGNVKILKKKILKVLKKRDNNKVKYMSKRIKLFEKRNIIKQYTEVFQKI